MSRRCRRRWRYGISARLEGGELASGIGAVPEGVWGIWACVNEFFPYQVSVVEEVEDRRQRRSLGDARGNGSPRLFEPLERQHSVPVPQEAAQPADHPVRDPSFA